MKPQRACTARSLRTNLLKDGARPVVARRDRRVRQVADVAGFARRWCALVARIEPPSATDAWRFLLEKARDRSFGRLCTPPGIGAMSVTRAGAHELFARATGSCSKQKDGRATTLLANFRLQSPLPAFGTRGARRRTRNDAPRVLFPDLDGRPAVADVPPPASRTAACRGASTCCTMAGSPATKTGVCAPRSVRVLRVVAPADPPWDRDGPRASCRDPEAQVAEGRRRRVRRYASSGTRRAAGERGSSTCARRRRQRHVARDAAHVRVPHGSDAAAAAPAPRADAAARRSAGARARDAASGLLTVDPRRNPAGRSPRSAPCSPSPIPYTRRATLNAPVRLQICFLNPQRRPSSWSPTSRCANLDERRSARSWFEALYVCDAVAGRGARLSARPSCELGKLEDSPASSMVRRVGAARCSPRSIASAAMRLGEGGEPGISARPCAREHGTRCVYHVGLPD
jgi:hypothetical protein